MPESERRLAAIVFTDVVGYTAIAQKNEALALRLLDEHRRILRPIFREHHGREANVIGDGFLVEFGNALDAVNCSIAIQAALWRRNEDQGEEGRILLRIGVHLGDVVHEGRNVSGDAVNVASRIEPLAEPGGICVTSQVYSSVVNKAPCGFESMGTPPLKNVTTPTEVFRVIPGKGVPGSRTPQAASLPKNRVVVLPFVNLSPDPNDEYFADGLTEELIDRLCQVTGLEVIARTSAMSYKKKAAKAADIGRELRTGSLVEGSVRKAGNKIRVTAQLVNANTEGHLWSSKYDKELEDVFAVQTDIAEQVAGALKLQLLPADIAAINQKRTESTEAYTLYLRGRQLWNRRSRKAVEEAVGCFRRASQADPGFALAHAGLADCYAIMENWGYASTAEMLPLVKRSVEDALRLDDNLAEAHVTRASTLAMLEWRWEEADAEFRRAIELNPSYATAHQLYAYSVLRPFRRVEEEVREAEKALELDPLAPIMSLNKGQTLLMQERYDEAIEWFERAVAIDPGFVIARVSQADCHSRAGRHDLGISMAEANVPKLDWPVGKQKITLAAFYGFAGRGADARRLLAEVRPEDDWSSLPTDFAGAYLALGEIDKMFASLERACEQRDTGLPWALTDPLFRAFVSDPRLQTLKKKVGLIP